MQIDILLKEKARPVDTIPSSRTVDDAIDLMSINKAGMLIVTENDQPVGIFAESDILRACRKDSNPLFSEIRLKDVMTPKIILAKPGDDISAVLALMLKADIKRLPVVEDKNITAILTLRDLVEYQIDALNSEIHQLKDYINDLHAAGQD